MKRPRETSTSRDPSQEPDHESSQDDTSERSKKSARTDASSSSRDDSQPTYGMFFGQQLAHIRLSDLWRWRQAYKRVRVTKYEDMEALYPFICACIEESDLAAKLEELVIGNNQWRHMDWYNRYLTDENRPAQSARPGTHDAILGHVRGLGLGEKVTKRMVAALNWKKQIYQGETPTPTHDDEDDDQGDDQGEGDDLPTSTNGVWLNMEFASAATVVLLSLCHNITTVHIDNMLTGPVEMNRAKFDILGAYLIKCNYGALANPGLQKLKTVIVDPRTEGFESMYEDIGVTDIIRCFHRLPSLESIRVSGANIEHASERHIIPPGTGNFKSLQFDHVDLRGCQIASMIRVAKKNLEEFSLSLGGLRNPEGSSIWVHPKTLGKSLEEHKNTLRILDLDIWEAKKDINKDHETADETGVDEDEELYSEDPWHKKDEEDSDGPIFPEDLPDTRYYGSGIGSLHDFAALTHLSIQPERLAGSPPKGQKTTKEDEGDEEDLAPRRLVDMLPATLESICFYGYKKGQFDWLDEQMEELMARKADVLPNLKEIKGYEEFIERPSKAKAKREEDREDGGDKSDDDGGEKDEDEEEDEDEDEEDSDDDDDDDDEKCWKRPKLDLSWVKA